MPAKQQSRGAIRYTTPKTATFWKQVMRTAKTPATKTWRISWLQINAQLTTTGSSEGYHKTMKHHN
jgi:hypothetical protein